MGASSGLGWLMAWQHPEVISSLLSRPRHERQRSPGAIEQSTPKLLTGPGLMAQGLQGPRELPATTRPPEKDTQDPAQLRLLRMQEGVKVTVLQVLG